MFDEQEFREWLNKYTKEQLIDLYIQKTFDVYMTTKYGEGRQDTELLTSGYLQEINPDGTSKYPVLEPIETTAYCTGCEEKDKTIVELENKIDKLLELFEKVTENIVDICEECKEVGDYGN